jgi:hypothetical protein
MDELSFSCDLYSKYNLDGEIVNLSNFQGSIINYGKIDDFQWLFRNYIENGNLEGIKKILPYTELSEIKNKCFVEACKYGRLEMAQLIYLTNKPNIKYKFFDDNYENNPYGDALKQACEFGKIDIVKWLLTINESADIICKDYYDAFQSACIYRGYLEIAKILYDGDDNLDINYISHGEHIFERVCRSGKLEIAKWLYSLGNKINIDYNKSFKNASRSDNIEIIKWLYPLTNNYDIHEISYDIFYDALLHGNLDIAKWIYSIDDKLDIRKYEDFIFKKFTNPDDNEFISHYCREPIKTLEYIISLCDDYEIEIENYKIKRCNIKKQ